MLLPAMLSAAELLKQEKIDEKEIVINDFWLDETKGSYNKESKILELRVP